MADVSDNDVVFAVLCNSSYYNHLNIVTTHNSKTGVFGNVCKACDNNKVLNKLQSIVVVLFVLTWLLHYCR